MKQPLHTVLADRIFDGRGLLSGLTAIGIAQGRITRLERVDPRKLPAGEGVLDARGATVLPGLVNSHVHIARTGFFEPIEPLSIGQIAANLRTVLAAGITTVGDMGCAAGLIAALRAHVAKEPLAGPDILAAGPILTAPRGYPLDWMPPRYQRLGLALSCGDERSAKAAVARVASAGMDHVKLAVMHRSYSDRPLPAIEPAVARAIVAEAHLLKLRVLAHAHSLADYRVALEAGADALMHCSFEPLDADTVKRVVDRGVSVCTTLWVFGSVCLGAEEHWEHDAARTARQPRGLVGSWSRFAEAYAASGEVIPPGIAGGLPKERAREGVRVASANLLLLRDAGVPIAFGDDSAYGYCVHGRPQDELGAISRAGLPPLACLEAATSRAAALLALADRGRIAPGLLADLVVAEGDLERDLSSLAHPIAVVHRGELVPGAPRLSLTLRTRAAALRGLGATVVQAWRG